MQWLDWRALSPTIRERYETARQAGRPLVGGHRGNPAHEPENTLRSFRSAIEAGVDLIECDVHMSSDGRLVVIHDHTLERTTDGTGLVRDQTFNDLRRLDAGKGEQIPLLEEVIETARDKVGLVIEIKQIPIQYPRLEEELLDTLRGLDFVEQATVISFFHPAVRKLKGLEPRLHVGILEGARPIDPAKLLQEASADVYSPHWGAMDPELVEQIHAVGGGVGVWTVDDDTSIMWCRLCGPDSIFTNRPAEVGPIFNP